MKDEDKAAGTIIVFFGTVGLLVIGTVITLGKWGNAAVDVWKLEQQLSALSGAGIDSALVTEIAKILAETIK